MQTVVLRCLTSFLHPPWLKTMVLDSHEAAVRSVCVCVCCNTLPCEQFTSKSAKNANNNKTSSLFIKFVGWLLFRGVLESFSVSLEACRTKVVLGNFKKALNLVPVEEGICSWGLYEL